MDFLSQVPWADIGPSGLLAAATTTIVAFSPIIPIDGARNVGPLATVMLLHGYLAARMAPTLDTPAEPE